MAAVVEHLHVVPLNRSGGVAGVVDHEHPVAGLVGELRGGIIAAGLTRS